MYNSTHHLPFIYHQYVYSTHLELEMDYLTEVYHHIPCHIESWVVTLSKSIITFSKRYKVIYVFNTSNQKYIYYTERCPYSMAIFLQNSPYRHPGACPWGVTFCFCEFKISSRLYLYHLLHFMCFCVSSNFLIMSFETNPHILSLVIEQLTTVTESNKNHVHWCAQNITCRFWTAICPLGGFFNL